MPLKSRWLVIGLGALLVANAMAAATWWAAGVLPIAQVRQGWVEVPWLGSTVRPPWMVFIWYAYAVWAWLWRPIVPPPLGPLILAVGTGTVWLAVSLRVWRQRTALVEDLHGSSRWATAVEVAAWVRQNPSGVVLGKVGRHILYSAHNEHVLLTGPTESGKSISCAIPTLRDGWQESAVVLALKQSMVDATIAARRRLGPVYVWHPTAPGSTGINVLDGVHSPDDARAIAHALVIPGEPPHWHLAAEPLIEGAMLHLRADHVPWRASLSGLRAFFGSDMEQAITSMAHSRDPEVRLAAQQMLNRKGAEPANIWSTANTFVSLFRGHVAAATDHSSFPLDALTQGQRPVTLYLRLDHAMLASLGPLVGLIVTRLIAALTARGEQQYRRRVLFLLDEFPQLGRLAALEHGTAFLRDFGVKFLLIGQSLHQIYEDYGPHTAILDNCQIQIAYGSPDWHTNEYYAKQLGSQTVTQDVTRLSGRRGGWRYQQESTMPQQVGRPLQFADELRRLAPDQELVFLQGRPPILASKLITPDPRYGKKDDEP